MNDPAQAPAANPLSTRVEPLRAEVAAELAGFVIQAKTMDEAMKLCEWISRSSLIPKQFQGNPQAIWTAGAMGQKLGLDLLTAMGGIASINGRPAIWGDLLRALILNNPLLDGLEETFEGAGETLTAVCTITRRGLSPYTAKYGIADAKAAGLLGKEGPWRNYTPDMLLNRAFGRAARRRFADVLAGLSVAEEMEDAQEVRVVATEPGAPALKEPKRRTAREPGAPAKEEVPAVPAAGAEPAREPAVGTVGAAPAAVTQPPTPAAHPRMPVLMAEARLVHESGPTGAASVRAVLNQLNVAKVQSILSKDVDRAIELIRNEAKVCGVTLPPEAAAAGAAP